MHNRPSNTSKNIEIANQLFRCVIFAVLSLLLPRLVSQIAVLVFWYDEKPRGLELDAVLILLVIAYHI